MAEHGEWNRQGATLSDVTAKKEYGVSREFIVEGIRAGKLEYREGSIWGNPYLRVLRSQLEQYIVERRGKDSLTAGKHEGELRKVESEIRSLKRKLAQLEARRTELQGVVGSAAAPNKRPRRKADPKQPKSQGRPRPPGSRRG
jgi:hypothetical protein